MFRNVDLEKEMYSPIIDDISCFLKEELSIDEFPENLLFKTISNISKEWIALGDFTFYNGLFLDEFYTR
ncbi:hypothetical protein ACFSTE_00400 [Aquimarina hainanensis]|uniref:Uncharacterized protein n=1 Tax=Aquimarina hainanensis TaxID=1578017 RepID=A0ABW5N579_9FLAO